jgi:hypothetical protein
MSLLNLLVAILVILLVFHLLGGVVAPGYRAMPYYLPGGVGLLVVVLIVIILMRVV